MDWASYYPAYAVKEDAEMRTEAESHDHAESSSRGAISKPVEIADIGCGYGGLLFALAPKFPDTLMLGGFRSSWHSVATSDAPHHIIASLTVNQAWRSGYQ